MKTKQLKFAFFAAVLFGFSASYAQSIGDVTTNTSAIRVIDNKGTIKYFQSNNGITQIVNTTANLTTTTWQLGGTLTDNTFIDLDGNVFGLNGLALETGVASTDAADGTDAGNGETGWALLVRDEVTGETRKMLASNLVSGIRVEYTQTADASADVPITVTGLPALTAGTTAAKLFVYRNGAKLRPGTDFTAAADIVTITYSATDIPMYAGDIIDIQYIQ